MNIIYVYIIIINLIGFIIMAVDKRAAIKRKWRISEKQLFFIGIIGGALGIYISMYTFRHKTKHWYFKIGMPIIIALQLLIGIYFIGI